MNINPISWISVAVKLIIAGILGAIISVPVAFVTIAVGTILGGSLGGILAGFMAYGIALIIDAAICSMLWNWK